MDKIKVILFDMDGVLIDAKDWHYNALNKALKIANINISREEHLKIYDALPTQQKLEILSKRKKLDKSLHPLIQQQKQQYTLEYIHKRCQPTPYHIEALKRLQDRGYRMAVCSNSIRESINIMMKKSQLEEFFDFYISNEDVQYGKPHPEMYLKAMERFNITPQETLIVEDSEKGIQAATASGAYVMRVNSINDVTYENIMRHILMFQKS